MPLGLTVSGRDTSVPLDSVHRLAATLQQRHAPVLLIDRPEAGHETCYADGLAILELMLVPR